MAFAAAEELADDIAAEKLLDIVRAYFGLISKLIKDKFLR